MPAQYGKTTAGAQFCVFKGCIDYLEKVQRMIRGLECMIYGKKYAKGIWECSDWRRGGWKG